MKFKHYRLQNAAEAQASAGGAATSTTDTSASPNTTAPATTDTVSTDTGATQPAATDTTAQAAADTTQAAPAVPETYEFKFADGMALDSEVAGEFSGIAKELGLSQEGAQKVADLGAKMAQKFQAEQAKTLQTAGDQWAADAQADPEIGGDKLDASLAAGQRALKELGTPALTELLKTSRLGNHPEVIRFFARVGEKVSADQKLLTTGNGATTSMDSAARRMFPNMNP